MRERGAIGGPIRTAINPILVAPAAGCRASDNRGGHAVKSAALSCGRRLALRWRRPPNARAPEPLGGGRHSDPRARAGPSVGADGPRAELRWRPLTVQMAKAGR